MGKQGGRERSTAKGREYRIDNAKQLAALVLAAIEARYGGSQNAAAKATGVPRSVLGRLCAEQASAVRHETVDRLRRLLGQRADQLEAALLSPDAKDRLRRSDVWRSAAWRCESYGPERALARARFDAEREALGDALLLDPRSQYGHGSPASKAVARSIATEKLSRKLRRRFPAEWSTLDKRLQSRRHLKPRAELAILRVISPLLDWMDTGGIERAPAEMNERELRQFLRAGIKRECIMLDRDTDIRRAGAFSEVDKPRSRK